MVQRSYRKPILSSIIVSALVLGGCVETDGPRTMPIAHPGTVGPRTSLVRIEVKQSVGYSGEDRRKLDDAVRIATDVINSSEFQEQVLAYGSDRSPMGFSQAERAFPDRAVASNQEVVDALLAGNAPLDGTIRLFLSIERNRSEVGHTLPVQDMNSTTFTDHSIFQTMGTAELANHLVHEHLHRIGFLHHKHYSIERCDSIPYAVGRLVCTIAKDRYHATGSCAIAANGKC